MAWPFSLQRNIPVPPSGDDAAEHGLRAQLVQLFDQLVPGLLGANFGGDVAVLQAKTGVHDLASVFLSLLYGVNTHSAFAASVSTLTNVGPALEELGTMGSYNSVPDAAKILYSMNMFFGRIEIYPVLAVISMLFTRNKR